MISSHVANAIANILNKHKGSYFLFQTNCEDVAIHTKNLMLNTKLLKCIRTMNPVDDIDDLYKWNGGRPKRVDKWLASSLYSVNNSVVERAEGDIWSAKSFLPDYGRPETEINCNYQNTLVHRFLMTNY